MHTLIHVHLISFHSVFQFFMSLFFMEHACLLANCLLSCYNVKYSIVYTLFHAVVIVNRYPYTASYSLVMLDFFIYQPCSRLQICWGKLLY
jgi:hypothetical protein